ncbi:MAG: GDP-mannose 4,6-dehydratase, partial [Planctomycetaceae bacterium]
EILRDLPCPPRFLHASSREIFGTPQVSPQDENTPVNPNSPYGCAKAFATQMVRIYRESHGLFFCNAICYNHESPRRGENFVTRKISLAVARIQAGLQRSVTLGDLQARRDWGYAADFVDAMWRMLQQPQSAD